MFAVVRALGDPRAQRFNLRRIEGAAFVGRWHALLLVFRGDAGDELTVGGFAGNNRKCAVTFERRLFPQIESELCLAGAGVAAVTREAVRGKDRQDVARVIHLVRHGGASGPRHEQCDGQQN